MEGVRTVNRFRVSLLALALGCAGGVVFADLLITRDGATIETAGAWRVEGRRVLFTLPNGTLSSIRTDEIDLDRSALATARAAEAASAEPAAPAAPAASILTLNEDDLAKEVEGEEAEGEKKSEAASPSSPLEVSSWEQMPIQDNEGVQLFGVVKNRGTSHLTAVTVTAVLYGEEGGMLANGDAQLNKTTIAPGETANFRVEFPGLPDFASVKFETAARGFETRKEEGMQEEFDELGAAGEGEPPAEQGAEAADAERDAASEAAAVADYNANLKATGSEPPPVAP